MADWPERGSKMKNVRFLFAVVWWGVTLIGAMIIVRAIAGAINEDVESYARLIGFAVWLVFSSYTMKSFIVSVPEVTGLATINLLAGGALRPYGPGIHFKYPWEQVKDGNYINFRIVKVMRTETYPAQDGPALDVKWFFQYRPRLELLGRYIAVSQDVIDTGLTDVGSSFLSAAIARLPAEFCKTKQALLEKALKEAFDKRPVDLEKDGAELGLPAPSEDADQTLEYLYGIHLVEVGLNDVDYEERYQKARATKAISKTLRETAEDIKRDKDIPDKDAMNIALIINGHVEKRVQEVEGRGGQALAALLMAMAGGRSGEKEQSKKKKGGGENE